ncbi:hypothetical protein D3C71_1653000 [compost metagenome]
MDTQWIAAGRLFTIYTGYFQLGACADRTYVLDYGRSRHHFTRSNHAPAIEKTPRWTDRHSWNGFGDYRLRSYCAVCLVLILSACYRRHVHLWIWRFDLRAFIQWDGLQVRRFQRTRKNSRRQPIYSGFGTNNRACPRRSNLRITGSCGARCYGDDPYSSGNTRAV